MWSQLYLVFDILEVNDWWIEVYRNLEVEMRVGGYDHDDQSSQTNNMKCTESSDMGFSSSTNDSN